MIFKPNFSKGRCHAVHDQNNVIAFIGGRDMNSVNRQELTSIRALTAFVAHNQNVREETVRAFLKAEFGVQDIASIRQSDFERAIAFLVDLRCSLATN